ncbi:MAG: hypothetical protein JOZ25_01105 [Actinobacteria bacterium]|nr:hypothetical protein [Actinomycetota bacterium]
MIRSRRLPVALLLVSSVAVAVAGCGSGSHFKNNARPAVTLQITGVVNDHGVSIEPSRFGAGPVLIQISNQTQQTHTVTLEGGPDNISEEVGPIHPLDTAQIQVDLKEGDYTVSASSSPDTPSGIAPAVLAVGPPRQSSSGQVLLP